MMPAQVVGAAAGDGEGLAVDDRDDGKIGQGQTRRTLLAAAAATALVPLTAGAEPAPQAFPKGFRWGAATAAYQVEGGNVGSDVWVLENVTPTVYPERSGDACDHYHRYGDDIALLRGLGFDTYRLSIEWSRIEPEPGAYSTAELQHYRRVLAACHEAGVSPMVTYNHFSLPWWIAARGGWQDAGTIDAFVRFCERVTGALGDLIDHATTFNEPNLAKLLVWSKGPPETETVKAMLAAAARRVGSDRFVSASYGDLNRMQDAMTLAHARAYAAIKAGPGDFPVGVNLAIGDEQAVGPVTRIAEKEADIYDPWFEAAKHSDFIGVQAYTRTRVGPNGNLPPEPGVALTQLFYEYWPQSLEGAVRYTAGRSNKPIWITENGVGTDDDAKRVEFIRRALPGLRQCIADGIDVRGYVFWSLLDNFEWTLGYKGTFGLVAVDRETFKRTPKPSAYYLGASPGATRSSNR